MVVILVLLVINVIVVINVRVEIQILKFVQLVIIFVVKKAVTVVNQHAKEEMAAELVILDAS